MKLLYWHYNTAVQKVVAGLVIAWMFLGPSDKLLEKVLVGLVGEKLLGWRSMLSEKLLVCLNLQGHVWMEFALSGLALQLELLGLCSKLRMKVLKGPLGGPVIQGHCRMLKGEILVIFHVGLVLHGWCIWMGNGLSDL